MEIHSAHFPANMEEFRWCVLGGKHSPQFTSASVARVGEISHVLTHSFMCKFIAGTYTMCCCQSVPSSRTQLLLTLDSHLFLSTDDLACLPWHMPPLAHSAATQRMPPLPRPAPVLLPSQVHQAWNHLPGSDRHAAVFWEGASRCRSQAGQI